MTEFKTPDALRSVASQAQDAATQVVDRGREASEGVGEVAGNVKRALDKSMANQPMVTMAVTAAVGFVLGALWKS